MFLLLGPFGPAARIINPQQTKPTTPFTKPITNFVEQEAEPDTPNQDTERRNDKRRVA